MIRIATIANLSATGYTLVEPTFDVAWLKGEPTDTYHAMVNGECDAALFPVGRLAELDGRVQSLGNFGIACRGAVMSVRLFSKCPMNVLIAEQRPVYLTPHSQTSRRLFEHLCRLEYGRGPRCCANPEEAEGCLLIGNEAVGHSRPEHHWPVVADLGQWWFEQTGRPFVFARWICRNDVHEEMKGRLHQWIEDSVAYSTSQEGKAEMARRVAEYGFSKAEAATYCDRIHYRLTLDHLRGLDLFMELQQENSQWLMNA